MGANCSERICRTIARLLRNAATNCGILITGKASTAPANQEPVIKLLLLGSTRRRRILGECPRRRNLRHSARWSVWTLRLLRHGAWVAAAHLRAEFLAA